MRAMLLMLLVAGCTTGGVPADGGACSWTPYDPFESPSASDVCESLYHGGHLTFALTRERGFFQSDRPGTVTVTVPNVEGMEVGWRYDIYRALIDYDDATDLDCGSWSGNIIMYAPPPSWKFLILGRSNCGSLNLAVERSGGQERP